eukprot:scaffold25499_cov14-Tisochrysis_lutea.AAC.1
MDAFDTWVTWMIFGKQAAMLQAQIRQEILSFVILMHSADAFCPVVHTFMGCWKVNVICLDGARQTQGWEGTRSGQLALMTEAYKLSEARPSLVKA